MLEQLLNLVQDHSQDDIQNNPAIPNEHNNAAVGLATESVFNGLQGALASGGIGSILGLLGGKTSVGGGNPLVNGIMQNFAGGLMNKLGIGGPIASGIAASLIPKVLSGLVGRTSNPNDSGFNINGLLSGLMGGNQGAGHAGPVQAGSGGIDFNSILSQLTGGAQVQAPAQATAHDQSGFGMDDIMKLVTGGGGTQAAQGGGGIMDILSGLTGAAQQQQQQQQQQQSGGGIMDMLSGFLK